MLTVPKPFPKEFREDVIRVYRESDASMAQVAKDFGISESCLQRWIAVDDKAHGAAVRDAGPARSSESAETRELKKRIRLLEQENEVLRRATAYFAQANLPGK
jgi:transposase-like protein